MITSESVTRFLAQPRITVVGASDEKSNFGGAVYRALKAHGYDVAAVHPQAQRVDGDGAIRTSDPSLIPWAAC
jgi:predicted CoA-binding protein